MRSSLHAWSNPGCEAAAGFVILDAEPVVDDDALGKHYPTLPSSSVK